jgi:hypothetical protein
MARFTRFTVYAVILGTVITAIPAEIYAQAGLLEPSLNVPDQLEPEGTGPTPEPSIDPTPQVSLIPTVQPSPPDLTKLSEDKSARDTWNTASAGIVDPFSVVPGQSGPSVQDGSEGIVGGDSLGAPTPFMTPGYCLEGC